MYTSIKKLRQNKIFLTIFYSIIFSLGIILFLSPAKLISTGLTGVAQIIDTLLQRAGLLFPFSVVYFLLNIPGLILSYFKLGKKLTYCSFISIVTVSLATNFFIDIQLTGDRLLNCIFAGIIMGYGIGGLLKIGSSSGGTDFYALWLYKKFGFQFVDINYFVNIIIIISSVFIYDLEVALYTFLALFIRQITTNFIYTNNNKLTVWIIDENLGEISDHINNNLGRGTSIFKEVSGGYSGKEKEVIMVILNIFEYADLKEDIKRIAPNAFVTTNKVYELSGNYRCKRDME